MTDNQTTDVESKPVKHRKRVLVPPPKPVPRIEEGFVTPKGYNMEVVPDGTYGMYKIHFPDGGHSPPELHGRYTSSVLAEKAIEHYLRNYKYR